MLSYGAACYTQCGTIQARVLRKPVCACFCIETLSFKSSLVEFCEAKTNVFFFSSQCGAAYGRRDINSMFPQNISFISSDLQS